MLEFNLYLDEECQKLVVILMLVLIVIVLLIILISYKPEVLKSVAKVFFSYCGNLKISLIRRKLLYA